MSKIGGKGEERKYSHDLIVYLETFKENQWKNSDYQELSDPIQDKYTKIICITPDERRNDWACNGIESV